MENHPIITAFLVIALAPVIIPVIVLYFLVTG